MIKYNQLHSKKEPQIIWSSSDNLKWQSIPLFNHTSNSSTEWYFKFIKRMIEIYERNSLIIQRINFKRL